jgi:hypothetical protein
MKKILACLILLIFFKTNGYTQSDYEQGYVQITEKDTIFGLINYKDDISNNLSCFYKKNEGEPKQKFSPDEIYGYRFNNSKYYISKEIQTKDGVYNRFVEYLLKGTVNLYYYRDTYGDHYLIQKAGLPIKEISIADEMIYLDNVSYKRKSLIKSGIIRYYLGDCPELFEDIDKIKTPSHLGLIRLIKKYHDIKCPNDICIIYKKTLPKFRMYIQPISGFTSVPLDFMGGRLAKTDYMMQYGLLTYIWMPLSSERIFFRSGILYTRTKVPDKIQTGITDTSYYSNNNYFRIPLQFQYVFLKHRISPTFGGGLNITFANKQFFLIPALNLGVNLKINDRASISCYSELDYMGQFYFIPDKTTKIISKSLNIGLTFKL